MQHLITINQMSFTDLETIADRLLFDFDDFWSYQTFANELQNKNSYYIVAKQDNNILGFGGIWQAVDDAHITNLVVHKNFRQKGIGSLLLEKLIQIARKIPVSSITLEVNTKNISAQKLYEKYKFEKLGIRKNYYKNDDAIIMTLFF